MPFGEEDKRLLTNQVAEAYKIFIHDNPWHGTDVYLSPRLVAIAIDNAVEDMTRMAAFHMPGGAPDRHKIAGFVARWIARERPIQFIDRKERPANASSEKWMQWANARFAVRVLQAFLRSGIPSRVASNLAYWFAFRDERGETLALIAYCCENMPEA